MTPSSFKRRVSLTNTDGKSSAIATTFVSAFSLHKMLFVTERKTKTYWMRKIVRWTIETSGASGISVGNVNGKKSVTISWCSRWDGAPYTAPLVAFLLLVVDLKKFFVRFQWFNEIPPKVIDACRPRCTHTHTWYVTLSLRLTRQETKAKTNFSFVRLREQ